MRIHPHTKASSQGRSSLAFGCAARALVTLSLLVGAGSSMELFNVKFVEQLDSRLIATSNSNYAIASPKLASKNWRTVSINGDQVLAISRAGEKIVLAKASLSPVDLAMIESLRDEIANSNTGYTHTSTALGGNSNSGFMMSSGTSSSSISSSSFSSSSGGTGSRGDMSYSMRDKNNFSVARSDLPFNWSRVFFNDDLVTLIYRNGDVHMLPLGQLEPGQLEAINRLKGDIADMQRAQANTMQNSMNMVSSVFNNIMSQFPRPPNYQSAVGGLFGNNFPFGPDNSPFDSASGWPFGGGSSAGALAFAGRR